MPFFESPKGAPPQRLDLGLGGPKASTQPGREMGPQVSVTLRLDQTNLAPICSLWFVLGRPLMNAAVKLLK